MLDDLIALFLEHAYPVRRRRLATVNFVVAPIDARGGEQVEQLFIGQQAQTIREELPPRFADRRMLERADDRFGEIALAGRSVLPDLHGSPAFELHFVVANS